MSRRRPIQSRERSCYRLVAVQLAFPLRTHSAWIVKVSEPDTEVGEANTPVMVSTKGVPTAPKLRPTIEKVAPSIGTGGESVPQGLPSKQPSPIPVVLPVTGESHKTLPNGSAATLAAAVV